MNTNKQGKLYFSIAEVAEKLQVNESRIRFWEKEFPSLKLGKKQSNGKNRFTSKDIEELIKIKTLVDIEGFTLDGVKKKINTKSSEASKEEILERLIQTRSFLNELLHKLENQDNSEIKI